MMLAQSPNDPDEAVLALWTIYDSPSDYPGWFVVRKYYVGHGHVQAGTSIWVVETLAEARAVVPPDLYNLGRRAEDDECVVETWC